LAGFEVFTNGRCSVVHRDYEFYRHQNLDLLRHRGLVINNPVPMHDDTPFTRLHALIIAAGILLGHLIATRLF
jgi:hypothetical protein